MAAPDLLHWNVEQPGSTGLCKVSYSIDESKLPSIYAVPIKVMSGPKGIRVKSQRLRSQAIKQFRETYLSEFDKISAVQYCAKKDEEDQDDKLPLDCLLFLVSKGVTRKVSQAIKDLKREEKSVTVVKRVKHNDGNYESQSIHCALKSVSHVPYGSDSADYWKKLGILIRTFIRNVTIDGTTFTKSTELLLEPTFPFRSPESQEDTGSHETNQIVAATAIPNAQNVSTLSRIRPKLDPILKELHFELDLVPGIEKDVRLSDLVFGIFGRALTGPGIHHHLKDIRGMLTGLVVDQTYQPERPSQSLSSDATSWCVIRDVQLAGEIPSFIRNGQRYSVVKYFKEGKS
ncbi:hypothetical protein N0V83_000539 [Neocucurbitaria cava]|uniref:Uncharacterized protein n=1 Tax=Neocucurbitaria cava TaxID=798079 RepID=A0A9W8YGK7_9PLEO|nr:hypothetical protein N0V83_000539 [Neocucurbitaria cava]